MEARRFWWTLTPEGDRFTLSRLHDAIYLPYQLYIGLYIVDIYIYIYTLTPIVE